MEERTIEIPISEYKELLEAKTKIDIITFRTLNESGNYIHKEFVEDVLGVKHG